MNQSIHPCELNGDHIGALVRWEDGKTIHQGHLESVEHGYDLIGPDDICDRKFLPTVGTLFTINGAAILVPSDWTRARIEIIKERA
ncbi:hypothetical protein [Sanguibacter massiliensis]|uniref:hypothetical protein n=1 Tax=Sanguibacter massiliensis TaxID=1973217 RepID=UPI000C86629C|nr:hypothetical protein [Sanguibacter massiliensis]